MIEHAIPSETTKPSLRLQAEAWDFGNSEMYRQKQGIQPHWNSLNVQIHPWKLTCPLKRDYFNRKYIFQPLIFRGHVSFPGNKFTCFPYLWDNNSQKRQQKNMWTNNSLWNHPFQNFFPKAPKCYHYRWDPHEQGCMVGRQGENMLSPNWWGIL